MTDDHDDTWRCVHCGDRNAHDGPVQCNCGTMKNGWECCSACEGYGPISTFLRDADNEPICSDCYRIYYSKGRNKTLYIGALVLLAVAIVLWAMQAVVE